LKGVGRRGGHMMIDNFQKNEGVIGIINSIDCNKNGLVSPNFA
jgi:hypothetical protein